MTIFRFRSETLRRPLSMPAMAFFDDEVDALASAAACHFAICEDQPVVVDDDWNIDDLLCDFARRIMATERSELTALSYVREAQVFSRYLIQRHGRSLSQIRESDLWSYRKERLHGALSLRLEPTSWNKVAASLLRLLRFLNVSFPEVTWRNLRASIESDDRVRMISIPDYIHFRDYGMAAKRNPLRNAAFADLSITTGMRCTENSVLLRSEIPRLNHFEEKANIMMKIPAAITKGGKRRNVPFSKRLVSDFIIPYIDEERSHVVRSTLMRMFPLSTYSVQALDKQSGHIFFIQEGPKIRVLAGEAQKILVPPSKLTKRERRILVEVVPTGTSGRYAIADVGHLWVSETGSCPTSSAWQTTFDSACKTLSVKKDPPPAITPHVLRHTFAVHQLNFMLRGLLNLRAERGRISRRGEVFARIVGDPLRTLQLMLGHSHIQSTYKYLTYVEDNHELVSQATDQWDVILDRLQ